MTATLRYEFRMQLRRPALWIAHVLLFAVLVVLDDGYWTLDLGRAGAHDPREAMITAAEVVFVLLPLAYACLLTDRLARDRRLGVAALLDSAPASRTGRLVGKYLGVCAATAVPIALAYFGRAAGYAVTEGEPAALGWAVLIFLAAGVPCLLFLGALTFAGQLLVPSLLLQVLLAAYWFWGNLIPASMMPTLSRTVLAAKGDYAWYGFFAADPSGHAARGNAAFDVLRPAASPATALLWTALMIAFTAALLLAVRLHSSRNES
ncbi:hypothetical protein ACFOWE_17455 [Planomonospora corallina]|uniref:ABC transporter permease n=1 Tax=Planomonospora corallina TaxID=1806052 RepID=A0ABV8I7Y5_9ACTN